MPETPARSIRIPDEVWIPALDTALRRGEKVPQIVTEALRRYVKRHMSDLPAKEQS